MASSRILERALGSFESRIQMAEINNKKKEEQENILKELEEALSTSANFYTLIQNLTKELTIKATNLRNTRKTHLENETKRVLSLIFPDEKFDVKIDWSELKGVPQAQILTGLPGPNGNIEWCPPRNVHGELAKQLISFTILCNISIMLGASFFGSDEALNSGDNDSLMDTKPLMDKLSEALQFVVIEHKEAFFNNIDRKEIHLKKVNTDDGDKYSGHVVIEEEKDITVGDL